MYLDSGVKEYPFNVISNCHGLSSLKKLQTQFSRLVAQMILVYALQLQCY